MFSIKKLKFIPVVKICLSLLSKKDKRYILVCILIQILNNFLDIFGVILMGIIGALLASYLTGNAIPEWLINVLVLNNSVLPELKFLIMLFGVLTAVLFITKSAINLVVNFYLYKFLGNRQSIISSSLVDKILESQYIWFREQNLQNITQIVFRSADSAMSFVIGPFINIVSDTTLLILIMGILIVIDPSTSFFTLFFFGGVWLLMNQRIGSVVKNNGKENTVSEIKAREYLSTALQSFRELNVYSKKLFVLQNFSLEKRNYSRSFNKSIWLQTLPRNIFEISLIFGSILIVLIQVSQNTVEEASAALFIFLSSVGRALPTLLRIQSGLFLLKSSEHGVFELQRLFDEMEHSLLNNPDSIRLEMLEMAPSIHVAGVSFNYSDSQNQVFEDLCMTVPSNQFSAIVGPSGAGKSTLVNLFLGLLQPVSGEITLNTNEDKFSPGSVKNLSFVSQSPYVFPGSILENVTLGLPMTEIDWNAFNEAINASGLKNSLDESGILVDQSITILDSKLNRGMKQRICIARALYFKPKLLIIDEGTSSLDGISEKVITENLKKFSKFMTIVVIAHRLSSIKNADMIFYLKDNKILGQGNFFELQKSLPEFKLQVQSMGM
jgi:ATP-binding cassette subfamily C protein